ncbi:amidohydrolase [Geobacter sulfurreducens]|uniref:amidohydrolase n=1 Tax=Geobacter sulfurreducens TaxID=35554 RepID=UPI00257254BE|nr:amidohydrolase [Geobacter sulfurreducens]BEH09495.1 amidohydrolase [Geobacter sulfurreducens subsp. ethanolicus]HML78602.1 amidohydrolase [Geobacter sulfurreducens]
MNAPDLILHNGTITTLDDANPRVSAIAMAGGRITATGGDELLGTATDKTQRIDLKGRRVIPGLNDSHMHVIRGGLTYNLELRWDGVPSLADGLRMLKEQAQRTPPGQWVRVIGGWSEFQFAERRMPTLDEINAVAPDTPVFVLHLYCRGMLNKAALRACGYTKDTPDPPAGEIQRDKSGNPTGLLIARPNAGILYATVGKQPKLPPEHQMNSSRHFMRELNRLGLTSLVDAGGGSQIYPDDYAIIEELHRRGEMTVRMAYNIFTQKPKEEKEDFLRCMKLTSPGMGDDFYRCNGAGEMLVYSAADFEDFLEPRPALPSNLEKELKEVVSLLAANKWPFRLHATYDESISRMLDVFEEVNREIPFTDTKWFFDHCETISDKSMERVKALGGGIAIQNRMAFQGEYFLDRYGKQAAERTPPVRKMLDLGIPVGAGTDATRVSSYNPWVSLYWLVAGKTVGGAPLYSEANRLSREEALRLYTQGSSWFSGESGKKGIIAVGQLADVTALTDDYFTVPEVNIKGIESVLTIVDGKIVYGAGEFGNLDPTPLPVLPEWSPVKVYGGYGAPLDMRKAARAGVPVPQHQHTAECHSHGCQHAAHQLLVGIKAAVPRYGDFWGLGCDCFAF